jgi:adenine-specific DNA-methyltransferase
VQEAIWALDKVKSLSERSNIRILDPACGSAEFLREALRQLKIQGYIGEITIYGWDISPIACEMSVFVLNYENITEWSGRCSLIIENRDSLSTNWNDFGGFDIVLMNPPFRSFESLGERKQLVLAQLDGLVTRQPDMAAAFWKKAAESVSEKGVIGIVMPHSILGAETYKKLRDHIRENLGIEFSLIARLGSAGLFEKAMIIPSVIVGTKANRAPANTILWTDHQQSSVYTALRELRIYRNEIIPTPVVTEQYSIYDNNLVTKGPAWTANSFQMNELSEKLSSFSTVGNFFKVTRGADAGNNAAFILEKIEWQSLPVSEQKFFRPTIMRDSIRDGRLNDNLFLFYPYGKFQLTSDTELKKRLPKYFETKLASQEKKLKERKGFESRWWELSRPRSFHNQSKLVSSYFGKSGYFAFDRTGEYVVGQSFAWLPLKEEIAHERYSFAYLALLHSELVDKLLAMVCNVLDGGYYDLSKHYVEKMPLPDLTKADVKTFSFLYEAGESIYNGEKIDRTLLEQYAANVYGLNWEESKLI